MDILLLALNSRYTHTSFGLRYLRANLGALHDNCEILEFVIKKDPQQIVDAILAKQPKILGIGVYIWNTNQVYEVISRIKSLVPEMVIVLGGPEVSHEIETQNHYGVADYIVQGEGDFVFRELCEAILIRKEPPQRKIIKASLPEISKITLPYDEYTDTDVAHRVIYVEASRGCPYKCEYCLSSLDKSVRNFDVDKFLYEMQKLIDRGVRQFKFLDRTFNLSPTLSLKIMRFFLDRVQLGLFIHFEMVPDRLPQELRELIKEFPAGSLQFEVGVQTWNPQVAFNVSRRQDYEKIKDNFLFLRTNTGVHTHADLIVGLPGESFASFKDGFDALVACDPDEIQVGILKRLKGTPIARHDQRFEMVYSEAAPFSLVKNKDLTIDQMKAFNRFASYWDLFANSGNYQGLMRFFKNEGVKRFSNSLFDLFWDFSSYLHIKLGQTHSLSQDLLAATAGAYLVEKFSLNPNDVGEIIKSVRKPPEKQHTGAPKRQLKRIGNNSN